MRLQQRRRGWERPASHRLWAGAGGRAIGRVTEMRVTVALWHVCPGCSRVPGDVAVYGGPFSDRRTDGGLFKGGNAVRGRGAETPGTQTLSWPWSRGWRLPSARGLPPPSPGLPGTLGKARATSDGPLGGRHPGPPRGPRGPRSAEARRPAGAESPGGGLAAGGGAAPASRAPGLCPADAPGAPSSAGGAGGAHVLPVLPHSKILMSKNVMMRPWAHGCRARRNATINVTVR